MSENENIQELENENMIEEKKRSA